MAEIAFEHFDPEFELGNLDINGKPIRPRKKSGRKPNPPSPAQRKTQNRVAQRAFRERKRREMSDAETNMKKCLNMRDQAIKDAKSLQLKVEELIYENNFLKGQVLTLKIACMANSVDVPKFWDTGMRDKMGSNETTFSQTKDIPQSLEFLLDNKKCIVTIAAEDLVIPPTPSSVSPEMPTYSNSTQPQQSQQPFFNNIHQGMIVDPLLSNNAPPIPTTPYVDNAFRLDDLSSAIQAAANPDIMDSMLMQYLLQSDTINDFMSQMKDVPPELWLRSQIPPELAALTPPEIHIFLSQPRQQQRNAKMEFTSSSTLPAPQLHQQQQQQQYSPPILSVPSPTPTDYSTTFKPEIPVEGDFWTDIKNTTLSPTMSNKVYVNGPISPLDAVNKMRTMRDQNNNRFLLTPTELQRRIPHDPRIDLIPGPAMRDYMIVFQDYYNANELFNFLLESAMFIGGELGNPDCWFVPPNFINKYWFLCPNHRPTRPDNSVELTVFFSQRMIDSLKRRKEMYIMRDKHLDQFLPPTMKDSSNDMNEDEQSVYENGSSINRLIIENINKDIPRIISPNAFTL